MIKRKLFENIKNHLGQKEITLLVGPRQAGKTTLMEMLKENLEQQGARTLYLNLDIEWDQIHFESQAALVRKLELEIGHNHGYVFIDEIQRKENAGLFLKGIFDLKLPYKLIVSGSGSLELKEKIHESLVGRKRLFVLSTLNFEEFVHYKTDYKYENSFREFCSLEKDKINQLLSEYINFGGYPRLVLETRQEEKKQLIDEIYRSVIEKDISYLLNVEKSSAFSSMIRFIAAQTGNCINYSELSSTANISYQTVKRYLWYAQHIFLIDLLTPYATNIRTELSKAPIAYFLDLGFRSYALGRFGNLLNQTDFGFAFENFIYLLLKEKISLGSVQLNFWRSKDGAEVDFVLEQGDRLIPIEVKSGVLRGENVSRSFQSFIRKYGPKQGYVVTRNFSGTITVDKTTVRFTPFWELIGASDAPEFYEPIFE